LMSGSTMSFSVGFRTTILEASTGLDLLDVSREVQQVRHVPMYFSLKE
jgi:hypothetical protein